MDQWFNDSTSTRFTSRSSQIQQDQASTASSNTIDHRTESQLNHVYMPTDSDLVTTYEPPSMSQEDLLSYNEALISTPYNPLDENMFQPTTANRVGGTEQYDSQMMKMNYNNYAKTRNTIHPSFSPNIDSLKRAPMNPGPPLEPGMSRPTEMVSQKQGDKNQYRCWKHGCEGRTFSSSANLRRHLREKEGQGRKWMCIYCMKEFSRSSACRLHINEGVCFKVDASSQQPPAVKILY